MNNPTKLITKKTLKKKGRYWLTCFALAALIPASTKAYANTTTATKNACIELADSHYEHVFCEIKIKNPKANLPKINEFKKNASSTQYLLLKRHAKKLGITLIKQTKKNPSNSEHSELMIDNRPAEKLSPRVRNLNQARNKSTYTTKPTSNMAANTTPKTTPLDTCLLRKETIECKSTSYQLNTNIHLSQIKPKALESNNQLKLLHESNDTRLRQASRMYGVYIEKMLSIGLAYSTMSFTKFFNIYEDSQKQGLDFSKRMFDMFELLKQERKRNAIKERYDNDYPTSIAACMELNPNIIVCDNKKQNWVYTTTNTGF